MKLTKTAIDVLPPPDKGQVLYWFDSPRGFGVRVTPTAKSFIFEGRVQGRKRRVTIGRVDTFADLRRARAEAISLAAAFNDGTDPVVERARKAAEAAQEAAKALTLRDAMQRYADTPKKKGRGYGSGIRLKKAGTIRNIHTVTNRHFADWMGIPVTAITGQMVKDRHAKIATRAPTQANLAMRYLRAALNHVNAESDEPILATNPVDRLNKLNQWADTKPKTGRIERDDIPSWVGAVKTELTGLQHGAAHRDAMLFILLTGARLAEVFGNEQDGYPALQWSDVDLARRTVTFTDTKNRSDHSLPLGNELTAILTGRSEVSSGGAVFGTSSDLRTAFARIQAATGLRVTAHDLRRTFASVANSLDISAYRLKRLMNHHAGQSTDVTMGYIGEITTDDLREAMQRIEDFMLAEASA